MSSRDGLHLSPFLDSEQREHSPAKDFSAAELARRPWKAFWPPRSEETFSIWLRSEFPEVLSWRFDPDLPFDQPWREWLKSVMTQNEKEVSLKQDLSCKIGNQAELHKSELSSTSATDVEDQLTELTKIQVDSINYLAPLKLYDIQKPYFSQLPCGTQLRRTNLFEQAYSVEIRDICGKENLFKLDRQASNSCNFQASYHTGRTKVYKQTIFQIYQHGSKNISNARKFSSIIITFELATRKNRERGRGGVPFCECTAVSNKRFSKTLSGYNTAESCAKRLEFQFPAEAEAILRGRYRYIDVWRCIATEDIDCPLALCDFRTIATTDLRKIDIVYPHFSEEGYEVMYNPNHRWFYKKGMSKDEVVLFKLGDSLATVAEFAPHTAFIDPYASGNRKRSSIEVRAIIIG